MDDRAPDRQTSFSSSQLPSRHHDSQLSNNPNVFSDDFALETFEVSDGSPYPNQDSDSNRRVSHTAHVSEPSPRLGNLEGNIRSTFDTSRRDVGSQKRYGFDRHMSTSSRQDGMRHFSKRLGRASIASDGTAPSRSMSIASSAMMPRTQSPYQGATGPSQPYGMYPQDIGVARTGSSTTTSTARVRERSYTGPSGPTQPYGSYPQNTVPEDEAGVEPAMNRPLPVGFPGRSQDYRRRLGPDAEDADDIIGPDGYTEQLPPYTRYPENLPLKAGALGPASIVGAERERSGSSSNETLVNPFHSRESVPQSLEQDPGMERSRVAQDPGMEPFHLSNASSPHTVGSHTFLPDNLRPEPLSKDKEETFSDRVREKGKRKICFGVIPVWLVAGLVLILVAVIAGIIGGVLGHARGERQADDDKSPQGQDKQPLKLVKPKIIFTSLLTKGRASTVITTATTVYLDATPLSSTPSELPEMPSGSFSLPLQTPVASKPCLQSSDQLAAWDCVWGASIQLEITDESASLYSSVPSNTIYKYGGQPPYFDHTADVELMMDENDMERGPAWFFQKRFDKLVVVKEEKFQQAAGSLSKRWFEADYDDKHLEPLDARNWNTRHAMTQPTDKPWFCYWNDTILEGFIYATQNSSGANGGPLSSFTPISFPSVPSTTAFPPDQTSQRTKRGAFTGSNFGAYPKVMKIEELANPNTSFQPYCQQMQIMNDGTPQPLPGLNGGLRIVNLTINDQGDSSNIGTRGLRRRTAPSNACACEWMYL
ncbi:MAG: hypothetical protein Q9167_006950 [Letrouitia subvulpina]